MVTVEEVEAACHKNGFYKPLLGHWAACPLGQLARADNAADHIVWAENKYGQNYVKGFIVGFDVGCASFVGNDLLEGFNDGVAIRRHYYPEPVRYRVI